MQKRRGGKQTKRGRKDAGEKKEKSKRNIMIRKVQVKKSKREAVKKIMKAMGAKIEIKEIRKIKEEKKGKEMMWVRLENKEQKWKILERKRNMRDKKKRISEDLTWKERKIRCRLQEIARIEERKEQSMVEIREKWQSQSLKETIQGKKRKKRRIKRREKVKGRNMRKIKREQKMEYIVFQCSKIEKQR